MRSAILFVFILGLLAVPHAQGSTVLAKDLVYVGFETTTSVSAFDAVTGALIWSSDLTNFCIDGPLSVTEDKGVAYVGCGSGSTGGVAALSAATGEVYWTTNVGAVHSSPTVTKDAVYVGSEGGVWVLNSTTGQVIWFTIVGFVDSSPTVAKGVVYVSSVYNNSEILSALIAESGEILYQSAAP